jgi:uncharacterized protein YbjT (DUF2867 family)
MIIITGATGQLGRQIVEHLLKRVAAERIGVSVRDPQKAADMAVSGVRVRCGTFDDPEGLAHAFEGASQVLIVSVDKMGEGAIAQHRAAIAAAVEAGAERVLYTSHMGASHTSRFEACRDHAATEDALRDSGIPYTALRNGFYAASAAQFLGHAVQSGTIALPADGPVSWTAHADLAEAAAVVLAEPGRFDGPTPPLTASVAYAFQDVALLASQAAGKDLSRVTVPDDAFREQLVGRGVSAEAADQVLGIFAASRAGEFAAVDPTLAGLIGREPVGLAEVLSENITDPIRARTH